MIVVQKSKTSLYWDLFFSLWGKMLSIQDLTINKPPLIRKPRSYLTPNMYVQCAWSKCSPASELLLLMDILGTMLIHLPRQVHPNLTSRHVTFDAAAHWKYPDCRMFRAKDRHTIDFFFFPFSESSKVRKETRRFSWGKDGRHSKREKPMMLLTHRDRHAHWAARGSGVKEGFHLFYLLCLLFLGYTEHVPLFFFFPPFSLLQRGKDLNRPWP